MNGDGATSFRGRSAEQREVETRLEAARLVTIVGPGGAGKSRLAREVMAGWRAAGSATDLAELSTVRDPALVASAVAAAVGLRVGRVPMELSALVDLLGTTARLLVLDNCEHLIGPVGELAEVLLAGCAELRILATSRSPLSAPGQHVVRLPPLAPADAVELFTDRAGAIGWLAIGPDDGEQVAELCRRLDGLPLAIEIAAGWTAAMSPAELVAAYGDRSVLLDQVDPSAPDDDRHRSLGAVLAWSYELLEPDERQALDRLSVMGDRFDLPAAAAVLDGASAIVLRSLAERSLVTVERLGSRTLFRLHGAVRAFAGRRLEGTGERPAALSRLGLHLADRFDGRPDDGDWLAEIGGLMGTLTAAIDDLVTVDPATVPRLVRQVSRHLRARRNLGVGVDQLAGWASRLPLSAEARDLVGDLVMDLTAAGRYDEARPWARRHEAMTEVLGGAHVPLRPTELLDSVLALVDGNTAVARDLCRQVLAGEARYGRPLSPRAELDAAWTLGATYHMMGDVDRADALARQALDVATHLGDLTGAQEVAGNIVYCRALRTGRAAQAGNYLRLLDRPYYEGEASGAPPMVEVAAWVALEIGHTASAARLARLVVASPPIGYLFDEGAMPEDLARAVETADPDGWRTALAGPVPRVSDALALARSVLTDPDLPPLDDPIEIAAGPDEPPLAAPARDLAAGVAGEAGEPAPGLLRHLPPGERQDLLERADRRRYNRGAVLHRQGEPGGAVHLVVSGWVAHQMVTVTGDTAMIDVVGPGDLVGDLGLVELPAGQAHLASAVALGPVETVTLHRWELDELRRSHPPLQDALLARLVAQVGRLSGSLTDALCLPVDQRVLRRLADLCAVYGRGTPAGGPVEIELTQDALATMAGATRSTVNRVLRRAESAGDLALARARIVVLDPEALNRRAGLAG